ncbi:unnamed protein product [Parnassius apollo]|uniref:(apollo) hypothetical protein n=1 Tax=Parnassius apollo TaxID=110799 RepID=A0A8S3X1K9_PARAO|nr:unnamed protein product [Parnassius apollo]
MVGLAKRKVKHTPVYFGHPFQFWKTRQRCDLNTVIDIEDMKKLSDVVEYDNMHLQMQKLKLLLEQEEECLLQELMMKQSMAVCGYCQERERNVQKYDEEIKKEQMIECKKALEREKIAKGMQCTKLDEIQLRAMQKLQMEEKKYKEKKEEEMENMWHQILLDNVRKKEEREIREADRLRQEMLERRKAYDEQIASAKKERQETFKNERDEENKRLEKMKLKIEQEYYEAIKHKREQQMANRLNFIKGHEMKLSRLKNEKNQEREIDANYISVAEEALRKERQRKRNKIRALKQEESVFVDHYHLERKMAADLENETNNIIRECKTNAEKENDERTIQEEIVKKMKALQNYKQYLDELKRQNNKERIERKEQMERVKKTAYLELQRRLNSANEELKKQIEYRNMLTNQIKNNQKILETELNNVECKQRPFTKKAITFKEAMRDKINIRLDGER